MTTLTNGNGRTDGFETKGISRREFLFYLGGASAALFAAATCGGLYWFTQQRLTYGRASGVFLIESSRLPTTALNPVFQDEAEIWLVLSEGGLIALNARCVYDNYIFKWIQNNQRYECPACGSKFRLDGTWIEGPANRDADRFPVEVRTADDTRTTPADGAPVRVENATSVIVDTRQNLYGAIHATSTPYRRRSGW
jgi:nitrite reductase/ring-hydroxylating ferredoxin subunit